MPAFVQKDLLARFAAFLQISLMSCNLGYSFRFEQFADTFFYRLTFPQIFHDSLRALNL